MIRIPPEKMEQLEKPNVYHTQIFRPLRPLPWHVGEGRTAALHHLLQFLADLSWTHRWGNSCRMDRFTLQESPPTWTLGWISMDVYPPKYCIGPPTSRQAGKSPMAAFTWENQRTKYRNVLVMFDYQDVAYGFGGEPAIRYPWERHNGLEF